MADQLITVLSETGKYDVMEREHLRKMYDQEHELINADKETELTKNKFKTAQYSIAGAVTAFEYCEKGGGGGLNVGKLVGIGSMRVGGKYAQAKVVMDLRVINTTTGQVMKSVRAEGDVSRAKLGVDGFVKGVDFDSEGFSSTPLGEATREALEDAVIKLAKVIPSSSGASASSASIDLNAEHVLCDENDKCELVKVFINKKKGKQVMIFNVANKRKSWVALDSISEIEQIKNGKSLDEGDDVFVRVEGSRVLNKCLVLEKSKSSDQVVAQCGDGDPASYTTNGVYKIKG
jgi:hypothetical protein